MKTTTLLVVGLFVAMAVVVFAPPASACMQYGPCNDGCQSGTQPAPDGSCTSTGCNSGQYKDSSGHCVDAPNCPQGTTENPDGTCADPCPSCGTKAGSSRVDESSCESGYETGCGYGNDGDCDEPYNWGYDMAPIHAPSTHSIPGLHTAYDLIPGNPYDLVTIP